MIFKVPFKLSLTEAVTDRNVVISPLSTLLDNDTRFSFDLLKQKLGLIDGFMIRFDDPYLSINDAASNEALSKILNY